jgi:hypothetical protein
MDETVFTALVAIFRGFGYDTIDALAYALEMEGDISELRPELVEKAIKSRHPNLDTAKIKEAVAKVLKK